MKPRHNPPNPPAGLDWRLRLLDWLLRRGGYGIEVDSDPAAVRARYDGRRFNGLTRLAHRGRPELAAVEERLFTGRSGPIPIRIYRPTTAADHPLIVFFHGGGWVVGTLDSHDALCRRIARESMAVVVAVDYRRAPEHRFPAAVEDAWDAVNWAANNAGDLGASGLRLCVAGDSAGGNLAAVVTHLARDHGGPPLAAQILIYPSTDGTMAQPSVARNADAPLLTRSAMRWFRRQYLRSSDDITDPRFSPLLAENHAGLPPALILTAEFDPLLDDGRAYARVLRAAGTSIRYVEYEGLIHGFLSVPIFAAACSDAHARIAAAVDGSAFDGA